MTQPRDPLSAPRDSVTRGLRALSSGFGALLRRGERSPHRGRVRRLAARGVAAVEHAFVGLEELVARYPDTVRLYGLLRALRDQQRARGAPVTDLAALAAAAGVEMAQLPRLVATGIDAGWIAEDADGALSLTASAVVALAQRSGDVLDRLSALAGRWTAPLSAAPPPPPSGTPPSSK